jgi:hypothetical protein
MTSIYFPKFALLLFFISNLISILLLRGTKLALVVVSAGGSLDFRLRCKECLVHEALVARDTGASEVSRAELQENIRRLIQCIHDLKHRDSRQFLPLDAVLSMASIETYSYTI